MTETDLPQPRSTGLRQVALSAAILLYGAYAIVLSYVEYGGTCNLGGEGLLPALFIGAPLIALAATSTWLLRASVAVNEAHRWIVLLAMGLALLITIPQVLIVSVLGHHPCGAEFNAYLAFVEAWDRWVPVVNLGFIAIAAFVALGPMVRKVAAKTPHAG